MITIQCPHCDRLHTAEDRTFSHLESNDRLTKDNIFDVNFMCLSSECIELENPYFTLDESIWTMSVAS